MAYKDQPYRDSLRRNHWPDTRVGSYKDYALDWSRFLINESAERFATITHVQWFLPKAIQGNKINVQGDVVVIWLKPVVEGTYPVLCKIQDSAARIHYKAMYLTIGGGNK